MTDNEAVGAYLKASGMEPPPVTGATAEGLSVGGKWQKWGSDVGNGWKAQSYDGKGGIVFSQGGVNFVQPMGNNMPRNDLGYRSSPMTPEEEKALAIKKALELEHTPVKGEDGSYSIPHFGNSVFGSLEEAERFKKNWAVTDRTGIDKFLKKSPKNDLGQRYGTLSDYFKATPEEQKAGFQVWNNEAQDFADYFQFADETNVQDPSLDIPLDIPVDPNEWNTGGYL